MTSQFKAKVRYNGRLMQTPKEHINDYTITNANISIAESTRNPFENFEDMQMA